MNLYSNHSFKFQNYSYPKFPAELEARYLFESEIIKIPHTEMFAEIPAKTWVAFDEYSNLYTFTFDQFCDIYISADKKSRNYFEFIIDSNNNDYNPNSGSFEDLLETLLEDVVEKPVQLSLRGRLALVWDLLLNKKIFISKY